MIENDDLNDILADAIRDNPQLDEKQIVDAYEGCDEGEAPRAYEDSERRAHELVTAWLSHGHAARWGEIDAPPQSEVSRQVLIRAMNLVKDPATGEDVAVLPLGVLIDLLTDYQMALDRLASGAARSSGDEAVSTGALDLHFRLVQRRLAQDVGRAAWIQATGRERTEAP